MTHDEIKHYIRDKYYFYNKAYGKYTFQYALVLY